MVMANFDLAYKKTALFEGAGLSNDPKDRGGMTFCGISRKFHPDWPGWVALDAGDLDEAKALLTPFYRAEYWDRLMLGQMLNQSLADEIFDTAVNCGKAKAVKILQEALYLLRQQVTVDGVLGYKTLAEANAYKYPKSLLKVMNGLQFEHYRLLCKKDPSQLRFFRGWMERV